MSDALQTRLTSQPCCEAQRADPYRGSRGSLLSTPGPNHHQPISHRVIVTTPLFSPSIWTGLIVQTECR